MVDRSQLARQIDAEIARLRQEIGILRATADALRGTEPNGVSSPEWPGEFGGSKIEDVASVILAENKDGLTARNVADIAIERGYRSTSPRNPTNDPSKIRQSFGMTMKRLPDKFEKNGKIFRAKDRESEE